MHRLFISLVLLALSANLAWGQPEPPRQACSVLQAQWASSWPNSSRSRTLDENRSYSSGYRVGSPIDIDGGEPSSWHNLSFKLVNQPSPASFYLNKVSGQIQTYSKRFDHEQRSSYPLSVEAWLQGGPKNRKNPSGAQRYCNERFTQGCGDCLLQTITVNVSISDEPERPPRPRAPRVTGVHGSLIASWGLVPITPKIISHDVQYRVGALGPFRNGPQGAIGTSATIENLDSQFNYEVRIRATNALGAGPWSATTPARTTPPLPTPPPPEPEPEPDPPEPDPEPEPEPEPDPDPGPEPPPPTPRPEPEPLPEPEPEPEPVPDPPKVFALDFAHFANGEGITSDLVFVNVQTQPSGPPPTPFHVAIPPIRPALYFYDKGGNLIDPESVVDITGDLEVRADGGLSVRAEMEPLGELTISTHGRGELVSGSVAVASESPIGGFLRFDLPDIGVAGVGASQPVRDAIFPARREGGLDTAVAVHNLGEEPLAMTCRLMSGGIVLDEAEIDLEANGQFSQYLEQMFSSTDTSDFVGLVRCTAPGRFTGVAVEIDAGNRILTTLPVVPVQR